MPTRHMQVACGIQCAVKHAEEKRIKQQRAETRKQKQALLDKDRRHWLKKAQTAFNAYIRERDKGKPCISCSRYHGGKYDAGHYRPAGNNSALRFEELNTHAQCVPCNQHKSGNLVDYRINLQTRIGIEALEWLEGPHELKRWTVDELKAIEATYKAKCKELRALT